IHVDVDINVSEADCDLLIEVEQEAALGPNCIHQSIHLFQALSELCGFGGTIGQQDRAIKSGPLIVIKRRKTLSHDYKVRTCAHSKSPRCTLPLHQLAAELVISVR